MNIENEFIQIQYEVGSDPQLEEDIKSGDVIIGRLEVFKAWANGLCFVKCSGIKENIVINNANDRGPALQGDIVAVRMTRYEDKQGEVAVDDFDIEEKTPMSKVLADGRRIQNVKLTTDDKTVERKLSQDVRLRNAIGAPPYEQVQFPEGKSPHGAVVRVLWRRFNPYQIGRIADGVVRPGQQNLYNNYFYRFKLYNPKLPQVCVEGKDIPSMFHSTISQHFFLLKFESDPNGYLKIYKGDMSLAIIQYSLGNTMSVDTNNLIIQQSYGIPSDVYPADAEACVPETFAFPTEEEMKKTGRRDLRSEEFVCTIDPETARDLDDALSIRKTKKGTYKVGVHIADVSHFVKPGTALDEEAQQRSTSVYFVDKVVPMLPRRLCEDYCSLNPSEDKLAFSSLFELSEDGTVLEEWFGQSIIRSRCRLSYEQAQEIIDTGATPIDVTRECELSGEGEATLKEKVFKSVQLLYQVASVLRKKSLAKGRLTVPNTRLGFQFEEQDSKLAPKAFFVKSQIHANWLVEEFMLLANCRTAEKVVQYLPEGTMLRRHAPPEKKKLTVLKQSLKECGITLIGGDAKGLQDTLDSAKGHPCYEALSQLLKYSLCRAEYFANDLLETTFRSHFALGFPWYCHFTSPIRRYTDVVSHRQLLLALEVEKRMKESGMELPTVADVDVVRKPGTEAFDVTAVLPVSQLETRDYYYPLYTVEEFAERANEKKENARLAGDESLRMYFCLYVKALEKMRTKNPNIPKELLTTVAVLQLKPASVLLYSAEIATEVQMGLEDTKQRFMPISAVVVPGEGKTEVDGMAAAAAKAKNFVHTTDANTGDSTTPHILLDWGINPYTKLNVTEKMYAFSEAVASLHVSMHTGKMSLQMVLLPPWEREAYLAGGQKIPTSLVEFDN